MIRYLVLLVIGWSGIALSGGTESDRGEPARKRPGVVYHAPAGPWGNLEYYVTQLNVPKQYAAQGFMPGDETVWTFANRTAGQARQMLAEAGWPEDKLTWIDARNAIEENGSVGLRPPDPVIASLSAEERRALTELLGQWKANPAHVGPLIIDHPNPELWFRRGGVGERLAKRAAGVCYRSGRVFLLTEPEYVMRGASSEEEKQAFVRGVATEFALIARLRLDEDADAEKLADYWSCGHKAKDVTPILESVIGNEEVDYLDIAHLLPPLPRRLLYTYPTPEMAESGAAYDCYWTALNFFASDPDPRLLDRDHLWRVLKARYEPVAGDLEFGDLALFYRRSDWQSLHMAVHVAGGIYFSKNGSSVVRPWVLVSMEQLLRMYTLDKEPGVRHLRRKEE